MNAFFSSLVPSPFGKHLDRTPYHFTNEFSRYPSTVESAPNSLKHDVSDKDQNYSPTAMLHSIPPTISNNENVSQSLPLSGATNWDALQPWSQPNACTKHEAIGFCLRPDTWQQQELLEFSGVVRSNSNGPVTPQEWNGKAERVRQAFAGLPRRLHRHEAASPIGGEPVVINQRGCRTYAHEWHGYIPQSQVTTNVQLNAKRQAFNGSAASPDSTSAELTWDVRSIDARQLLCSPLRRNDLRSQPKGVSDASSGFVHTVKTASFSGASSGIYQTSTRHGRSTDFDGRPGCQLRLSVDSDRPPTASSMEDSAVCRGTQRQQIIQELINSEESYVGDLKALIDLWFSLLNATCSLTRQTENMIHRNLRELLGIHESLVEHLHGAVLAAANRRWIETASPRKLISRQHRRSQSSPSASITKEPREQGEPKSIPRYPEACRQRIGTRVADPVEAEEVARILKLFLPQMSAYEEYCTRYKIMMQQIQRYIPRWTAFEAGLEALAKSLGPLRTREDANRKALTLADLLMKPIQRVCKYPLLLSELLRNTPCIDCPSAHTEIEAALAGLRNLVKDVNLATNNPMARDQIQRKSLLLDLLIFNEAVLQAAQFRSLGVLELCGVLHVAYQTRQSVDGCYMLCLLVGSYFVLGVPAGSTDKFRVVGVIHLSDLKVDSPSDGRGKCRPPQSSY